MDTARARRVAEALGAFLSGTQPSNTQPSNGQPSVAGAGEAAAMELFRQAAATVPAYREFLREHGVDPGAVSSIDDFRRVPMMDKESYHRRYPLPERCRDGRLHGCDLVSVSSGSSGSPTIWPRSVTDELAIARRFEQVFRDGFQAARRATLAVVCARRPPASAGPGAALRGSRVLPGGGEAPLHPRMTAGGQSRGSLAGQAAGNGGSLRIVTDTRARRFPRLPVQGGPPGGAGPR